MFNQITNACVMSYAESRRRRSDFFLVFLGYCPIYHFLPLKPNFEILSHTFGPIKALPVIVRNLGDFMIFHSSLCSRSSSRQSLNDSSAELCHGLPNGNATVT